VAEDAFTEQVAAGAWPAVSSGAGEGEGLRDEQQDRRALSGEPGLQRRADQPSDDLVSRREGKAVVHLAAPLGFDLSNADGR
jgi:hypothetical protein